MFDLIQHGRCVGRARGAAFAGLLLCGTSAVSAASPEPIAGAVEIDRQTYRDQMHGFWLAQSIANWTGLRSEGRAQVPPFPTDADWGGNLGKGTLKFVTEQDPWRSDDDTDIEYVLADLMVESGTPVLDPGELTQAWIDHINRFIWVSNERARELMDRGVQPPETSVPASNRFWLAIDAQLTTELMGAMAPGMPRLALELAEPAIATTAGGHAAHASQYFVVLHALGGARGVAAVTPAGIEQLVVDALAYIPPESKAADAVQFVLDDYRANPDVTDWERTRDAIYERYQLNPAANGFSYRGWTESTINFATGIMCLLYGQGDLKETIRIGTLSGWDSDNPTATMGGLLGLMLGVDGVRAAFPDVTLSDRYWILRTRDALPDYLTDDPAAEDTFAMLSERLMPIVDVAVGLGGGVRDPSGWLIPPQPLADAAEDNPRVELGLRSATYRVRASGGTVTPTSSAVGSTPSDGSSQPNRLTTGFEFDPLGEDVINRGLETFFTSENAGTPVGGEVVLTAAYSQPVEIETIRFVEGDHVLTGPASGGWFQTFTIEVRIGGSGSGVWQAVPTIPSRSPDPARPFEIIDFRLAAGPAMVTGIRLRGLAGGSGAYVTCAELDAFGPKNQPSRIGWDLTGDQQADIEDLYRWTSDPVDLNRDGVVDADDRRELVRAVRWFERRPARP